MIPLICIFGSKKIIETGFNLGYGCLIPDVMRKERIEFKEICKIQDASALDLLNRMLELDHKKRITAEEALRHSFFSKIYAE